MQSKILDVTDIWKQMVMYNGIFFRIGFVEIKDAQGQVCCASEHLLFVYYLEEKAGVCLPFLQTM